MILYQYHHLDITKNQGVKNFTLMRSRNFENLDLDLESLEELDLDIDKSRSSFSEFPSLDLDPYMENSICLSIFSNR